jgi:nicotinate-nucleotide adenylyltransferase
MGGTFDPVHIGHLILAEQAKERFGLNKVLFVTAANPPHKPNEALSDAAHRLEMTRLAVEDNDFFECSTIEIDRAGTSYTIDTIRQLLDIYGEKTEIYLLIGADECRDLMSWREPHQICALAKIVVANRPGLPVEEVIESLPANLSRNILRLQMPSVEISSTGLRERIRAGRTIRYLVPQAVEDYIWAKSLYR